MNHLEDRLTPSGWADDPNAPDHDHGALVRIEQPPRFDLGSDTGFLTGPQAGEPRDLALAALKANAAAVGLLPGDVADPIESSGYSDGPGGMSHFYFQQNFNGLPVMNTSIGVHLTGDGRLISVNGGFVPGLSAQETGTVPAPAQTPTDAVAAAARYLGYTLAEPPVLVSQEGTRTRDAVVTAPAMSANPIPVKLTYVYTEAAGVRLGWELNTYEPGGNHAYDAVVDAQTGAVLYVSDWVHNYSETYRVQPFPTVSPAHGPRAVLVNPGDPTASLFGWLDTNGVAGPEFTDTRGNNVFAQADRLGNDNSNTRPSGGPGHLFDFPINLTQAPTSYTDAATAQLFYSNNVNHDVHLRYGFTEQAGNFQQTNYSGQGRGSDPVQADAQDGSGLNNANMFVPPDGVAPRMQMFLFSLSNPMRDGDFENGIVTHEYGHGVSVRLTGGPANSNSLNATQSGGMGEGWSDWWAMMLTQKPSDTAGMAVPMGTYVLNQPLNGPGVRNYPYSFDMAIDPHTFNDYGIGVGKSVQVHDTGEIWASALWDMNWLLIGKYGFDPDLTTGYATGGGTNGSSAGNKLAMQLVMDGLKLQPANPTFIEARDAILRADRTLTGGVNQREIWQAFARRGLGSGASTANSNSFTVTTSFAMPGTASNPAVTAQSPAGRTANLPTSLTLTFSEAMNPASFSAAADVLSFTGPGGVDLKSAITGATWVSTSQLRVDFSPPGGNAAQGAYTLVLGPDVLAADNGSPLDQDLDGTAGEATEDQYTARFQFDAQPLTVAAVDPVGGILTTGLTSLVVTYSEPVDPATVGANDLQISRGTVTGFTVLSPTRVQYDLFGLSAGGRVYISIKHGAVTDAFGFPVEPHNTDLPVDPGPPPVLPPLSGTGPLGWQAYESAVAGQIATAGVAHDFSLALDPGTRVTVVVDLASTLQPVVQLRNPLGALVGSATAPVPGRTVVVGPFAVGVAGTYSIRVAGSGATTGDYRVRVLVGSAPESEAFGGSTNSTLATSQNLNAALVDQGGGADATTVLGRSEAGSDYYRISLSLNQTLSVGLDRLSAGSTAVSLLDANGTPVVAATTAPTNFEVGLQYTPLVAGVYYLRVTDSAPTDYLLSVVRSGALDQEGNDTAAAAQPITAGTVVRGGLTTGDADWYSVTLAAGAVLNLVTTTPGDGPGEYVNRLDPVITVWSGGTVLAADDDGAADGRNAVVRFTAPAAGTYLVSVTASGPTAGEYVLVAGGVGNQAPVGVSAGVAYSVTEGGSVTLTATATDPNGDALTYSWDLNNDNVFTDATGRTPALTWAQIQALGIGDGPAPRPVRVRVSDGGSAPVVSPMAVLTVLNAPPTAVVPASLVVREGSGTPILFADATDPSAADVAAGLHYAFDFDNDGTFDLGDGTYAGSGTRPGVTLPASMNDGPGSLTVRVRVIDKDGGTAEYRIPVTLNNVAPSATLVTSGPFPKDGTGSVSLTNPSDPSAADTAAGFRYSFDFGGDGVWEVVDSPSPTATIPSAFLTNPGDLQVKARISDRDGEFTEYSTVTGVVNTPPTATVTTGGAVREGQPGSVRVTGASDPSPVDTAAGFHYAFDFNNDGVFEIGNGTYAGSGTASTQVVPAAFLDDGPKTYTIRVRVIDQAGGFTDYTPGIAVTNVAPTATLSVPASVTVGSQLVATLTDVFDPSAADTRAGFKYSFDLNNDGDFTDRGEVAGATTLTVPVAYQVPGRYTLRVRVADKDGAFTDLTRQVTVGDAPPTGTITVPSPVREGTPVSVSASAAHPSTVTTAAGFRFSYDFDGDGVFDLGDGRTYAGSVTDANPAVPAGLVADGPVTRTVRVKVFASNGLSADLSAPLVVQDVAPAAAFVGPTGRVEAQSTVTFALTGATDPSAADAAGLRYSFDVNGDGDFSGPGDVAGSATGVFPARFARTGQFTVLGRVTSPDGAFADYTLPVTVSPVTKSWYGAGSDAGDPPLARLYDPSGALLFGGPVFIAGTTGGVRVAVGDVNGDGTPDLVTGSGPGTVGKVMVVDGRTRAVLHTIDPFGEFTGGVFVAAGDVDGDGLAEVAVSPDRGGGPRVVVYRGGSFQVGLSFFGIDDPKFRGGARVAMADVNGDGLSDLLVAAGPGGGPRVAGYDGETLFAGGPFLRRKLFNDFFAFDPVLSNGVYLAGGDVDGDGKAEVITGAGPGGGPQVVAFGGAGLLEGRYDRVADFFTGNVDSREGVRVAVADVDGDFRADIVTGSGDGSGTRMSVFRARGIGPDGRPTDVLDIDPFAGLPSGVYVG